MDFSLDSPPHSVWNEFHAARFPALDRDAKVDVCVIGAGIFGMVAAYLMAKAGKRVLVLERDRLGAGETGRTSAHLSYVTDHRLHELAGSFGKDQAFRAWHGQQSAVNLIGAIAKGEGIECDFHYTPGFLVRSLFDPRPDEVESLHRDAELGKEAGFSSSFIESDPLFLNPAVSFPNQARFHPIKFISGVADRLEKLGSSVFERSDAGAIEDDPLRVRVNDRHTVQCEYLIVASHVPLTGARNIVKATLFQTKLAAYTSYVLGATVPRGQLPHALFWDTSNPYHYVRIDPAAAGEEDDYVIIGGLDHKTGQEDDSKLRYERLASTLHSFLPEARITHRWSGQVLETPDGLPYIGEYGPRQFTATGFGGNGLTFGTLAGMLAVDTLLGRPNPLREILDSARQPVRGIWRYLAENIDYPYFLVKDRLTEIPAHSFEQVSGGSGRIVNRDGQKLACYRAPNGALTVLSPVCPHMGCLVHWNDAEKSWDCPCHGSRFEATGKLISGPAEEGLCAVDEDELPLELAPLSP